MVFTLKKRSRSVLGKRWKDANCLAGVFAKDQSCCLHAKEGSDICLTTAKQRSLHVWSWGCRADETVTLWERQAQDFFFFLFLQDQKFVGMTFSRNSLPARKIRKSHMQFKLHQGLLWPVKLGIEDNHKSQDGLKKSALVPGQIKTPKPVI